jgi:hypothetical protein
LHEQLLFVLGTKLPRGWVLRHPLLLVFFCFVPFLFNFFFLFSFSLFLLLGLTQGLRSPYSSI